MHKNAIYHAIYLQCAMLPASFRCLVMAFRHWTNWTTFIPIVWNCYTVVTFCFYSSYRQLPVKCGTSVTNGWCGLPCTIVCKRSTLLAQDQWR